MLSAGRETGAAASALGAYLTTVLPGARRELRRRGPLPADKVRNAEAVAVFATLAPRSQRAAVVRAIVALQVAIDLRDLAEEGGADEVDDADLQRLEESWRREVAALPAYPAVAALLDRAVARCEEGQRRTHAAAAGDFEPLREWDDHVNKKGPETLPDLVRRRPPLVEPSLYLLRAPVPSRITAIQIPAIISQQTASQTRKGMRLCQLSTLLVRPLTSRSSS